jgi:hypothetical protein
MVGDGCTVSRQKNLSYAQGFHLPALGLIKLCTPLSAKTSPGREAFPEPGQAGVPKPFLAFLALEVCPALPWSSAAGPGAHCTGPLHPKARLLFRVLAVFLPLALTSKKRRVGGKPHFQKVPVQFRNFNHRGWAPIDRYLPTYLPKFKSKTPKGHDCHRNICPSHTGHSLACSQSWVPPPTPKPNQTKQKSLSQNKCWSNAC